MLDGGGSDPDARRSGPVGDLDHAADEFIEVDTIPTLCGISPGRSASRGWRLREKLFNPMAEDRVVAFPPDWEDDVPGIRARESMVDGRRWAIVAYDPGARREEWCRDGHWGLVLEGAVEYEFDDGGERLGASEGEAFFLTAGRGHRGRNLAPGETRLFLIDDPE